MIPASLRVATLALFSTAALALAGCTVPEVSLDAGETVDREAPTDLRPDPLRLAADVTWLADDAREGRRAGTEGERSSATWLAERFEELGLEPAGEEGYLQRFEVPLEAECGQFSTLAVLPELSRGEIAATEGITGGENLLPLFCSAPGKAMGPLVFRGYGMRNEDRDWDDYAEPGAEGEVVVIVRGTPDVPAEAADAGARSPHGGGGASPFGSSGSIFNKVMTAKHHGARAVILAQHPRDRGEPLLAFHNGHTAVATIPAVTVTVDVASRLVPGYVDRVAAIDGRAAETGRRVDSTPEVLGQVLVSADVTRGHGSAENVLGLLRGRDESRTVVLGAHFDHLGLGGTGSLSRDTWGEIHNGADDNASGTAVVLELARMLSQAEPPPCNVLFALWSGEELGLLGSAHWIANPTLDLEHVVCNLNFDMVGRAGDGELQVLGAGTSPAFVAWMEEAGAAAGLDLSVSLSGSGMGGSDHQSFLKAGIPALHFFSGIHSDYHKPSDDADRFEAEGAARTTKLALDLLERIGAEKELPFVAVQTDPDSPGEASRRDRSWSVWFGSVPSYTFQGKGLLLDGTSAGSPAERAGLLAGDIVLQIGDIEIGDIHDMVYALQVHKPGDVVEVRFLRGGNEERVMLTMGSRELE